MIDVAVAGGGPAGLALALLLCRAGLSVRVLEPRTAPWAHSRAIGLHPPAVDVLDVLGVGEAAVAAGVPIREGAAISGGREVGRLDFGTLAGRHRYVLALPQNVTESLLAERLLSTAPGVLLRGRRVVGLEDDGGGVAVDWADGSGRGSLRARVLVGADGVRSVVRDLAGIPVRRHGYPDRYVMGDFADDTGYGATAALFLHPDGIVESFPLPGGVRRWVVRVCRARGPHIEGGWDASSAPDPGGGAGTAGEAPGTGADLLAGEILRRTGRRADPETCTMLSDFRTRSTTARTMARGRVVLAGDAAHEISPIGGQGITLGLCDASALAALLVEHLGGTSPGERGRGHVADRAGSRTAGAPGKTGQTGRAFDRALADYSARRLAAARTAARQAHLNMALGRPLPGPLAPVFGGAVALAMSSAGVRRTVAERFTMGFDG